MRRTAAPDVLIDEALDVSDPRGHLTGERHETLPAAPPVATGDRAAADDVLYVILLGE